MTISGNLHELYAAVSRNKGATSELVHQLVPISSEGVRGVDMAKGGPQRRLGQEQVNHHFNRCRVWVSIARCVE